MKKGIRKMAISARFMGNTMPTTRFSEVDAVADGMFVGKDSFLPDTLVEGDAGDGVVGISDEVVPTTAGAPDS